MMNNIANLDLVSPGSLALKRLLNANWQQIDRLCITERVYEVSVSVLLGSPVAFDASGDVVPAFDDASVNLERKVPFGFAMNAVVGSGSLTVRMLGEIASVIVTGSPSAGDTLYLSGTTAGQFSTTAGPNSVACGISLGGSSVLFRPRLKVVT